MQTYPQRLVNVRVRERRPLDELDGVNAEIRRTESSSATRAACWCASPEPSRWRE